MRQADIERENTDTLKDCKLSQQIAQEQLVSAKVPDNDYLLLQQRRRQRVTSNHNHNLLPPSTTTKRQLLWRQLPLRLQSTDDCNHFYEPTNDQRLGLGIYFYCNNNQLDVQSAENGVTTISDYDNLQR
eukprot:gene2780-8139_t